MRVNEGVRTPETNGSGRRQSVDRRSELAKEYESRKGMGADGDGALTADESQRRGTKAGKEWERAET